MAKQADSRKLFFGSFDEKASEAAILHILGRIGVNRQDIEQVDLPSATSPHTGRLLRNAYITFTTKTHAARAMQLARNFSLDEKRCPIPASFFAGDVIALEWKGKQHDADSIRFRLKDALSDQDLDDFYQRQASSHHHPYGPSAMYFGSQSPTVPIPAAPRSVYGHSGNNSGHSSSPRIMLSHQSPTEYYSSPHLSHSPLSGSPHLHHPFLSSASLRRATATATAVGTPPSATSSPSPFSHQAHSSPGTPTFPADSASSSSRFLARHHQASFQQQQQAMASDRTVGSPLTLTPSASSEGPLSSSAPSHFGGTTTATTSSFGSSQGPSIWSSLADPTPLVDRWAGPQGGGGSLSRASSTSSLLGPIGGLSLSVESSSSGDALRRASNTTAGSQEFDGHPSLDTRSSSLSDDHPLKGLLAYSRAYDCYFVDPPPSVRCAVCRDTLNDPVMHSACGNTYCRQCIRQMTACPSCQTPALDSTLIPNHAITSVLGPLRVMCKHAVCSSSPPSTASTSQQQQPSAGESEPHAADLQPPSPNGTPPPKCTAGVMPLSALREHQDCTCPARTVVCPNGCGVVHADHHHHACAKVPCHNRPYGCAFRSTADLVARHASACPLNLRHIQVLRDENRKLEETVRALVSMLRDTYSPASVTPDSALGNSIVGSPFGLLMAPTLLHRVPSPEASSTASSAGTSAPTNPSSLALEIEQRLSMLSRPSC